MSVKYTFGLARIADEGIDGISDELASFIGFRRIDWPLVQWALRKADTGATRAALEKYENEQLDQWSIQRFNDAVRSSSPDSIMPTALLRAVSEDSTKPDEQITHDLSGVEAALAPGPRFSVILADPGVGRAPGLLGCFSIQRDSEVYRYIAPLTSDEEQNSWHCVLLAPWENNGAITNAELFPGLQRKEGQGDPVVAISVFDPRNLAEYRLGELLGLSEPTKPPTFRLDVLSGSEASRSLELAKNLFKSETSTRFETLLDETGQRLRLDDPEQRKLAAELLATTRSALAQQDIDLHNSAKAAGVPIDENLYAAYWAYRLYWIMRYGVFHRDKQLDEDYDADIGPIGNGGLEGVQPGQMLSVLFAALRLGAASNASVRSVLPVPELLNSQPGVAAQRDAVGVYSTVLEFLVDELQVPDRDTGDVSEGIDWLLDLTRPIASRTGRRPLIEIDYDALLGVREALNAADEARGQARVWQAKLPNAEMLLKRLREPGVQKAMIKALATTFHREWGGGLPQALGTLASIYSPPARTGQVLASATAGAAVDATAAAATAAAMDPPSDEAVAPSLLSLVESSRDAVSLAQCGFRGSRDIVRTGYQRFSEELKRADSSLTREARRTIFRRAQGKTALRALLIADAVSASELKLLGEANGSSLFSRDIPDLRKLFGLSDLCACAEGDSVLGAAAYLADALEFLRHRQIVPIAHTCQEDWTLAIDVLFARRPDLREIDLDDRNARTEMPFIDLVCEVLEDAVSRDWLALGGYSKPLKAGGKPDAQIKRHLRERGIAVSGQAAFVEVGEPWAATGACRQEVFLLRDHEAVVRFERQRRCDENEPWKGRILRQTTRASQELYAEPQFENRAAYEELERSSRGLRLPWSLSQAKIDAYLKIVGATRSDIRKLVQLPCPEPGRQRDESPRGSASQGHGSTQLTEIAERLGLQRDMALRIVATTPGELWAGLNQNLFDEARRRIRLDAFLERTRLSFAQAQALTRTEFLGAGSVTALMLAPPAGRGDACDTAQMYLRWKTPTGQAHLEQFLRLREHLGWQVLQLDRAIALDGFGSEPLAKPGIDAALLKRIADLVELGKQLDLDIDATLDLLGPLPAQGESGFDGSRFWSVFVNPRATGADEIADHQAIDVLHAAAYRRKETLRQLSDEDPETLDAAVNLACLAVGLSRAQVEQIMRLSFEGLAIEECRYLELCKLHACASLYRVLDLPWTDFLALVMMSGAASLLRQPSSVLRLLALRRRLESSGGLAPVQWLAMASPAHFTELPGAPLEPWKKPDEIGRLLLQLHAQLGGTDLPDAERELRAKLLLATALGSDYHALPVFGAWVGGAGAELAEPVPSRAEARIEWIVAWLHKPLGWLLPFVDAENAARKGSGMEPLPDAARLERAFVQLRKLLSGPSTSAEDAASWYAGTFAALHAWAELPAEALALAGQRFSTALVEIAGMISSADPEAVQLLREPVLRIGYVLRRPLERKALLVERETLLQESLGAFCGLDGPLFQSAWKALAAAGAPEQPSCRGLLLGFDYAVLGGKYETAIQVHDAARTDAALNQLWRTVADLALAGRWIDSQALDAAALDWLEGRRPGSEKRRREELGALGLDDLPRLPGNLDPSGSRSRIDLDLLVEAWSAAAEWFALLHSYPPVTDQEFASRQLTLGDVVDDVLEIPDADGALANWEHGKGCARRIERLTGWPVATLVDLIPELGAASAAASNDAQGRVRVRTLLATPSGFRHLAQAVKVARTAGLGRARAKSLVQTFNGGRVPGAWMQASLLKKEVRAKFSADGWIAASRVAQDAIRPGKRDALVGYLLGNQPLGGKPWDATALFEHYLIDTQMEPIMQTSRIVQAHAAVQTFVQRCLMGLETQVRIDPASQEDWAIWNKWMAQYRVWQANRKIFLYPENLMESALRDDKSPFFKELEDDLNQSDLGARSTAVVVRNFLRKVHEVARLDVVASYYKLDATSPVLHVVARTPTEPRKYFYRKWEEKRKWTPWEAIELEISGDHVMVYESRNRIYVAWLTFTIQEERKISTAPINPGATYVPDAPHGRWKVSMASSELAEGRWLEKRVAPDVLVYPAVRPGVESPLLDELSTKYDPAKLRPVFQDIGRPEILLLKDISDSEAEGLPTLRIGDHELVGAFALGSCLGNATAVPASESTVLDVLPAIPHTNRNATVNVESELFVSRPFQYAEGNATTFTVLEAEQTPGRFVASFPDQASPLDLALGVAKLAANAGSGGLSLSMGIGLPVFYSDAAGVSLLTQRFNDRHTSTYDIGRAAGKLIAALTTPQNSLDLTEIARDGGRAGAALDQVFASLNRGGSESVLASFLDKLEALSLSSDAQLRHAGRNFHPLMCELLQTAERRPDDVAGLFDLEWQYLQMKDLRTGLTYVEQLDALERGQDVLLAPGLEARDNRYAISYEAEDGYAHYNWEIFYHMPFTIASRLAAEGQFENAIRWFSYVFNPLQQNAQRGDPEASAASCWIMRPFRMQGAGDVRAARVEILLDPEQWRELDDAAMSELAQSIQDWRRAPFLPFQVGRHRWMAFQKAVVYKFIETLIAWGDARFRVDTREDITAATQLYLLALRLLGTRPRTDVTSEASGPSSVTGRMNYEQLQAIIDRRDDELSKRLDTMLANMGDVIEVDDGHIPDSAQLNFYNEYFCIPPNEKLLALWDQIEDRLFKIRNSQNIEGVTRTLALFAPPIDPALLARAAAAGLSIDQVVAGMNRPLPAYRFNTVLGKAMDFANELRVISNDLLQILEKRDAEELSQLRSSIELRLSRSVTDVRKEQVREAIEQMNGLSARIAAVDFRHAWYTQRASARHSARELSALDLSREAKNYRADAQRNQMLAAASQAIPTLTYGGNGAFGSPHLAIKLGGELVAAFSTAAAGIKSIEADTAQTASGIVATQASFDRRAEDWEFQADLAVKERAELVKQHVAAQIRLAIVERELRNHELGIETTTQLDEFLRSKFSSKSLYDWMLQKISGTYHRAYTLALEMAQRAEQCLEFELPSPQGRLPIIQSTYWDSLRKGLASAAALIHDLKRLDADYMSRNRRTPELTKNVSLATLDPAQLLMLRETGNCEISIPEAVFDLDHPGHTHRRIRSVTLSIPCIAGPFTNVSCELTLVASRIRTKDGERDAFEYDPVPSEVLCSSSGMSETGLFDFNVRDERYLPFEGAGAISDWRVAFPKYRQFDYASISDVVLQIRYTSRRAEGRRNGVEDRLREALDKMELAAKREGIWKMVSLRNDLPDQFQQFVHAREGDTGLSGIVAIPDNLLVRNGAGKPKVTGVVFRLITRTGSVPNVLRLNEDEIRRDGTGFFSAASTPQKLDKLAIQIDEPATLSDIVVLVNMAAREN
jgi:hypothetical protein